MCTFFIAPFFAVYYSPIVGSSRVTGHHVASGDPMKPRDDTYCQARGVSSVHRFIRRSPDMYQGRRWGRSTGGG